jgi:hypothetical protein
MVMLRPSRRVILAMLAGAGVASAGGLYFWTNGVDGLIGKILARRLPDLRIDAASIAALSRDVQATGVFKTLVRSLALETTALAASIVGVDLLARFKLTATEFSRLERLVLTPFILGSNYLDVSDPTSDLVTYYKAPGICGNRFAQYDH